MEHENQHGKPGVAQHGRPVRELSDHELEQQGRNAHDTRNWVFLNGTAEQFATHTTRMLERSALARLYTADPPLLVTEQQDRLITDAGQRRLAPSDVEAGTER
jgi:hypothetical protein